MVKQSNALRFLTKFLLLNSLSILGSYTKSVINPIHVDQLNGDRIPQLNASKTIYTDADEWINLQCSEWNKETKVLFKVQNASLYHEVMFDSSLDDPVVEKFKNKIRVNQQKNGIEFNVKGDKFGSDPMFCQVNKQRSQWIMLNHIRLLSLKTSSSRFEPTVEINCFFDLVPRYEIDIQIDYYAGDLLLGSMYHKNKTTGSDTNFYINPNLGNLTLSGKFNFDYRFGLTQTGYFPKSEYYCVILNNDAPSNSFTSDKVTIEPYAKFNSATATATKAMPIVAALIVFLMGFI